MSEFRNPEQMWVENLMVAWMAYEGNKLEAKQGPMDRERLRSQARSFQEIHRILWPAALPTEMTPAESALVFDPEPRTPQTRPQPVSDDGSSRGLPPGPGPTKLVIPDRPGGLPEPAPAAKIDAAGKWMDARIGMGKKLCKVYDRPWKDVTWAEALQFEPGRHDDELGYIKFLSEIDPKTPFAVMTIGRAQEVMDRIGTGTPF